ncbi:Uncharacterized protein BP5553_05775 [Venustampulla echinocandica]|uniref:Uncharacterized protein n=1 Tax=Venustampulla echinocandica TaxID=2656787 RepID=A0A370TLL6_9HELO|nr:Uncharacterized protein BP5553_05775 [Venustampulla echinocandica]RDL36423.1 Uncharacterized protein BP5553_05775 [Venustampulla echinocandica]
MRYQTLIVLASVLASVSALPSQVAKRDWVHDKKGNLKITFSDETVSLGTLPIDKIIDKMSDACHTSGQCDTSPIKITGYQLVHKDSVVDETLTINPSGSYPTWIRNGLRDALRAAVKATAKCETIVHTPNCGFSAYYCPGKKTKVTECKVPKYWGVNYQPHDLGNSAPPFMGADMEMKIEDHGFCSTFTTVGAAVAGAVNGVAGGIFLLSSLACN